MVLLTENKNVILLQNRRVLHIMIVRTIYANALSLLAFDKQLCQILAHSTQKLSLPLCQSSLGQQLFKHYRKPLKQGKHLI